MDDSVEELCSNNQERCLPSHLLRFSRSVCTAFTAQLQDTNKMEQDTKVIIAFFFFAQKKDTRAIEG
jgi:hypothetical protein